MAGLRRLRSAPGVAPTLLVLAYLTLGVAYALRTPLWQNPDEPAHFNYVHQLATGGGIPVLQMGDYDQAYQDRLVAEHFPPGLPVDRVRYEGHQPPLFYLAGAAVDAPLAGDTLFRQVVVLRLLSLVLGAPVVVLAWLAARSLLPTDRWFATAVAALPALLPQHVALAAAVNNDALSWTLAALVLVLSLRLAADPTRWTDRRIAAGLGLAMAAVLLTKTTAYAVLALPLLAFGLTWRAAGRPPRAWQGLALAFGIAVVAGGMWFARNLAAYGGLDFMGLVRHNAIAVGQSAALGWGLPELRTLATTLFQSTWMQLGWMTMPAQPWAYGLLAAATGMLGAGTAVALRTVRTWATPMQQRQLAILGALMLLALGELTYYNLQFLQPQGRYLFVALVPAAVFAALGLRALSGQRAFPIAVAVWLALLASTEWYAHMVLVSFLRAGLQVLPPCLEGS